VNRQWFLGMAIAGLIGCSAPADQRPGTAPLLGTPDTGTPSGDFSDTPTSDTAPLGRSADSPEESESKKVTSDLEKDPSYKEYQKKVTKNSNVKDILKLAKVSSTAKLKRGVTYKVKSDKGKKTLVVTPSPKDPKAKTTFRVEYKNFAYLPDKKVIVGRAVATARCRDGSTPTAYYANGGLRRKNSTTEPATSFPAVGKATYKRSVWNKALVVTVDVRAAKPPKGDYVFLVTGDVYCGSSGEYAPEQLYQKKVRITN
jgi:hypothetical protein